MEMRRSNMLSVRERDRGFKRQFDGPALRGEGEKQGSAPLWVKSGKKAGQKREQYIACGPREVPIRFRGP